MGTSEGQTAIAPGRLRRTWTENRRRYFHYVTDAPIRNEYAFFSAAYAVRRGLPGAHRKPGVVDVHAHKVVVDSAGAETEVPMNDLVEVGVFAAAEDGGSGEPLYLRMHRVRSGEPRITMTVPRKPARAGIDPRSLLIDVEAGDNLREITLQTQTQTERQPCCS